MRSFSFIRGSIGDLEVTVALTPDGYADSVHDGRFVLPEERRLLVNKFLDIMDSPDTEKGVYYIQKQNSNFMNEFQPLVNDIDTAPKWGTNVFGEFIFIYAYIYIYNTNNIIQYAETLIRYIVTYYATYIYS